MRVEAILMAMIANISRSLAKSPMTSPPCIQAVLMGDFARGREIFAIIAMRNPLDTHRLHSILAHVNIFNI